MGDAEVNIILKAAGVESVDQASDSVQKLGNSVEDLSDKTNKNANSQKNLGHQLVTVKNRAIESKIGILALTAAVVMFTKASYEAAMAAETHSQKVKENIAVLKEHENSWNRLKVSIGEGIINLRAETLARQQATAELKSEMDLMKLGIVERQKVIQQRKEEIKQRAVQRQEEQNNVNSMIQLLDVQRNVKQQIEDRIALSGAQSEADRALIELQIRHREEMEKLLKIINEVNGETEEETILKNQVITLQQMEEEQLKKTNAALVENTKATEDNNKAQEKLIKMRSSGIQQVGSDTYFDPTSKSQLTKSEAAKRMQDYVFKTGPNAGQSQSSLGQVKTTTNKVTQKSKV